MSPLSRLLLCAPLLTASLLAQTSLPAPRGAEVAITRILAARRDTPAFAPVALPRQTLSDLLWISTGINRPSSGHRTTNYSYASRDNELYLLCAEGVFVYDQLDHALVQHSATDLRASLPPPADTAPATFALVTYASNVNFFGAIHTGFISENIALACADRGLGSHVSTANQPALATALGLQSGHHLLLLHSVGHPEGSTATGTAWPVAAGPLVAAAVSDSPALGILKRRRSTRSFASTDFSEQTLAELLWAGIGINNSNTLERTSPQTSGTDAIVLYVVRATGVHRYVPAAGAAHTLQLVSSSDLRGHYDYASVPAVLVYVADYSKLAGTSAEKQRAACLQAGHISQNIAAYAAAEGLGELVRSSVHNLATSVNLPAGQTQLFSQTLGYPANPIGASTVTFSAGAGGTLAGPASQSIAFGADATAVTAVPEPGHYFSHWSGAVGGRSTANPLRVSDATTAMTITATFVTTPNSYTSWASGNFSAPELADESVSGPSADPDHAGLSNLQRYAHDLAARGPATVPATSGTATVEENRFLTLTFTRRSSGNDLRYVVESSSDLVTWTALSIYGAGEPTSITAQDSVAIDSANPPRRFLRLRVTTE